MLGDGHGGGGRRRGSVADGHHPALAADAEVVDQGAVAGDRLGADAASGAEQVRRLKRALDTLPLQQRMTIQLAFYEGLTHVEIAERLEEPLGTVKTRIRLGLLKLKSVVLETTT